MSFDRPGHEELSDEDLMNDWDKLAVVDESQPVTTETEDPPAEVANVPASASEAPVHVATDVVVDLEQTPNSTSTPATSQVTIEEQPEAKPSVEADGKQTTAENQTPVVADANVLKQKADAYDLVFKPFNASGKQHQARSPEEVVRLMQMGVDYAQKNERNKPLIRAGKALESHGLLSDESIAYAIDLLQKKPEAIRKLIAESNIDVHDVDAQEASAGYRPQANIPSEQVLDLQDVADELAPSPHFPVLQKTVLGWDDASRVAIANAPQLLRVLHDHQEQGIFDAAMVEVERAKLLGQHKGERLLDVYDYYARQVHAAKVAATQPAAQQALNPASQNAPVQNQAAAIAAQQAAAETEARRKAAGAPRTNGAPADPVLDIANMTDAQILALDLSKIKPRR